MQTGSNSARAWNSKVMSSSLFCDEDINHEPTWAILLNLISCVVSHPGAQKSLQRFLHGALGQLQRTHITQPHQILRTRSHSLEAWQHDERMLTMLVDIPLGHLQPKVKAQVSKTFAKCSIRDQRQAPSSKTVMFINLRIRLSLASQTDPESLSRALSLPS